MKTRTAKIITAALAIVGLVLYIGWDIVVAYLGITPATISRMGLAWGHANTFTPFATGVVIGHVWWPGNVLRSWGVARHLLLGGIGLIVLVLDLAALPPIVPIVPFMVGLPIGHLLWAQSARHLNG